MPIAVPGMPIPRSVADSIIADFRRTFRVVEPQDFVGPGGEVLMKGSEKPTWDAFPEGVRLISPNDLRELGIPSKENLFLYIEYPKPGVVHQVLWSQILDYFAACQNSHRVDTYVFNRSCSWCIAYTHEDVQGVDAILVVGTPGALERGG